MDPATETYVVAKEGFLDLACRLSRKISNFSMKLETTRSYQLFIKRLSIYMSRHRHSCTSGALQARHELVNKLTTLNLSDSAFSAEFQNHNVSREERSLLRAFLAESRALRTKCLKFFQKVESLDQGPMGMPQEDSPNS